MSNNFDGSFSASSWGATKFIETSASAVDPVRLSQQVVFPQRFISVGWVSIHLVVSRADDSVPFSLVIDVMTCNIDGVPDTLLASSDPVLSSDLSGSGWYRFDIGLPEIESSTSGLCFVFRQIDGDQNNYASWGHNINDEYSGAMVSVDGGSTWSLHDNIHRVIRVAANFDAYSLVPTEKRISTPGGVVSFGQSFSGGEFNNTRLVPSSGDPYYGYQQEPDKIVLEQKNLHVSFVVDSSGSMGWRDRYGMRAKVSADMVDRFKSRYPGDVTFDFINFGGRPLDIVASNLSQRLVGTVIDIDDVSAISGFDADGNPLVATDVRTHLNSGIVSYGYKNLKSDTTYSNYGLSLGWTSIRFDSQDEKWINVWQGDSPSVSLGYSGPNGDPVLEMSVSDVAKNATRYVYGTGDNTPRKPLDSDVAAGDDTIYFDNSSPSFIINAFVNVVDIDGISPGKNVDLYDDSSVTFDVNLFQEHSVLSGAVIESSLSDSFGEGWGRTEGFEMFVVDPNQKGDITFYIQCANGAHIEWDFTPMPDWELLNLYFLDESAIFDVETVDANGNALPTGTTVEFYVDKNPEDDLDIDTENEQEKILLTQDALEGEVRIFVSTDDISKFSREDAIDIIDDNRGPEDLAGGGTKEYHTSIISEIVEETGRITISDEMPSDFLLDDGAAILLPATSEEKFDINAKNELPIEAGLVDVTPIYSGKLIDESLRDDLDPPQIDPSAGYDDYNADPSRVRVSSMSLSTVDGYAAVRLLPITEDRFATSSTKESLAKSMFDLNDREKIKQQSIDDYEKGQQREGVDDTVIQDEDIVTEEPKEPEYYDGEPDFVMNHKVVSSGPLASTEMYSFTKQVDVKEFGTVVKREFMAKTYQISPVMTLYDGDGEKYAIVLLDDFEANFAVPIFIKSSVDRTVTFYDCTEPGPEPVIYNNIVPGAYATDEELITISYDIKNRGLPENGTLIISIYDSRRTVSEANVQDEDLGNVDGCQDFESLKGVDNAYSTNVDDDEYRTSIEEYLLADDILGDSFASQFELDVAGGKASFTLPQIDRVALLEVHAEFKYDNGAKSLVNRQKIYYKNPVVIRLSGVGSAPADGETKVNLGASVSWKEIEPVPDGTIVSFEVSKSNISPSVSETIDSFADGVIVGPHEPIPPPRNAQDLADGGGVDAESVTATTSYRGFTSSKDGTIEWGSTTLPAENFYFYAKGANTNPDSVFSDNTLWSDGYDYVTINGDLPASSFRAFPSIDQVYQDLVDDQMGVVYSGGGLTAGTRLPRWSEEPPTEGPYENDDDVPYGWVTNRMYSNAFIGRPPYREPNPENPDPCDSPECVFVNLFTRSRKNNVVGIGIENETPTFPATTPGGSPAEIPKPRVKRIEPLGINLSMEPIDRSEYQVAEWRKTPKGAAPRGPGVDTYNHPIERDGESRYFIVAEVTWRDELIVATENNPLPEVVFEIGTYKINSESGELTMEEFSDPNEAKLDSPTATVSHLRTTCDSDHYHEVILDANGIGETIKTVSYVNGTVVDDHVHRISLSSDPIVSEASVGTDLHGHSLRSVAIVGMGPVRNKTLPIAVKGTVVYDNGKITSSGTRVNRELENYAVTSPAGSGDEENPFTGYKLEIITSNKQYVEGRVVDGFSTRSSISEPGYTILYKATIVTEDDEEGEGTPVPDGTRIFTDFKFFEFDDDTSGTKSDSGDVMIISKEETPKNYAALKINAFFADLPDEESAESDVMVVSGVKWFPSVEASQFIRKPESDSLYIESSISLFNEVGSSQLNDALSLAARRMVKFNDEIGAAKKIIVVISDMNESNSEYSFDQALADVRSVDVNDRVEIFPVRVSFVDTYSDLVANKYATDSGGEVIQINDVDDADSTSSDVVDAIMQSPNFDLTSGTYTNVVDIGDPKLFKSLIFSTTIPDGTGLTFRIRFSDDGINYGDWSILGSGEEFDISSASSFGRYMQYEVSFSGNPVNFDSPEFIGLEYEYFDPGSYTMFFQPIRVREGVDGYVGEIIFAHHGEIPETSEVRYGIAHCDSSDLVDYGWKKQPFMNDGFGGIILSRVNERLQKSDALNYTAPYGGWHESYEVEIYRLSDGYPNGILVRPETYSVDNILGKVSFAQPQPSSDTFTITLSMKPSFRIVVDMKNYGSESIYLDYLGTMYRKVDRSDIYDVTRKPVSSVVDTDLGLIQSSGEVSVSGIVFAGQIGKDSDMIRDFIIVDEIYYALVEEESGNSYIVSMEGNFVVSERYEIGSIGTSSSLEIMDGVWHVSSYDGNAIHVRTYDSDFNSVATYDFGFVDEHAPAMRALIDRWYSPNTNSVNVYGRSFSLVKSVNLEYNIADLIDVKDDSYTVISEKRDIIFEFSLDGEVLKAYSLVTRPSSATNIRRYEDEFYIIEPSKVSQGSISQS
jgi:hypothetical protein